MSRTVGIVGIILLLLVGSTSGETQQNISQNLQVLVIVAPYDYNEQELSGILSGLTDAGIGYVIASTGQGEAFGMSGGKTAVNSTIERVSNGSISGYAGIAIIGGPGSIQYLYNDVSLEDLVRTFYDEGKLVSAICASPVILSRAGVVNRKKITMFGDPALQEEVRSAGATISEALVMTDGRIITGNGPDAADEFGKTVASALKKTI